MRRRFELEGKIPIVDILKGMEAQIRSAPTPQLQCYAGAAVCSAYAAKRWADIRFTRGVAVTTAALIAESRMKKRGRAGLHGRWAGRVSTLPTGLVPG